jgi:hypothetical protein
MDSHSILKITEFNSKLNPKKLNVGDSVLMGFLLQQYEV